MINEWKEKNVQKVRKNEKKKPDAHNSMYETNETLSSIERFSN